MFVVTGRKEDVAMAKREILSAAEHFSLIRASRNKAGPLAGSSPGLPGAPSLAGQTTIQVRVPYRVVGLVVGPKGATIKRIQQQTHTYIVTPSRDKEPVFEVTGMPENVDRARDEIEAHIALRTGGCVETAGEDDDFHHNGTDVSFEGAGPGGPWPPAHAGTRMTSSYRNDSSSSLGSGSSDSYYGGGGGRTTEYGPSSPFSGNGSSNNNNNNAGFWFGETLLPLGSDDMPALEPTGGFEGLGVTPAPWGPFEQGAPPFEGQAGTPPPRLSPTFHQDAPERPAARRVHSEPLSAGPPPPQHHKLPACGSAFSSSGDSTASGSPPDSGGGYRARQDCVRCLESEIIAALVPCGHNLFCMECADRICRKAEPLCPVCQAPVTQAIRLRNI